MVRKVKLVSISLCIFIGITGTLWLFGRADDNKPVIPNHRPVVSVTAAIETEPVLSRGDAADDAAVWYNTAAPQKSLIVGTDKKLGLVVYDLTGKVVQYLKDGSMNNVDLRPGFPLGGQKVALVTASDQTNGAIAIYKIAPNSLQLEPVAARPIETIPPYGSCMYHSARSGTFYYFVNSRQGDIQQWALFDNGSGKVDARLVRTMQVRSTPEGCVADDDFGHVYIAEQDFGIWKFGAEPGDSIHPTLVDHIGPGGVLDPQIEGLDLYYVDNTRGYLIASSQGTNKFVMYTREGQNKYLTTFRVVSSNGIDEVTHTDGIAVTSNNFGPLFPEGFLVVQDHINDDYNQNFKLVPWDRIRKALRKKSQPLP